MAAIWSALESVYARRTTPSIWRGLLGDEYERVLAEYLRLMPKTAAGWPCPRNCGCVHEVMTRPNGSIAAVCACDPWDCPDIPLTPEDIALYEIDVNALGRAVAKAFGFQRRDASLNLSGTVQIGAWSDQAIPVILTVQWDGRGFRYVIAELVARLRKRFLLFTPTMRFLDAPTIERIASVEAAIMPLEAALRLQPDGSLRAVSPPQELLAPFARVREPESESTIMTALALIHKLDEQSGKTRPTHAEFFYFYCGLGLSLDQIRAKARCSQGTASNRKRRCEEVLKVRLEEYRPHGVLIDRLENQRREANARHIHAQAAIYDDAGFENKPI